MQHLKDTIRDFKRDLPIYQKALHDTRTPKISQALLKVAIGYIKIHCDIIPDFIPLLGQLDDAVVAPLLIKAAIMLIPDEVMEEYRAVHSNPRKKRSKQASKKKRTKKK